MTKLRIGTFGAALLMAFGLMAGPAQAASLDLDADAAALDTDCMYVSVSWYVPPPPGKLLPVGAEARVSCAEFQAK